MLSVEFFFFNGNYKDLVLLDLTGQGGENNILISKCHKRQLYPWHYRDVEEGT